MNSESSSRTNAWVLLLFLTFLNVLNFVDRQLISSLAVPISAELKLEPWQIALLSGYAFAVLYGLMGLVLGVGADHWNRVRLIAVGLALWSGMTAACGLARNFSEMTLARVFVGVGEAALTPAALAMLGEAFPKKKHSVASGVYYLGIPFGASLSLVIAGTLVKSIGWRNCFFLLGGIGVVCAGLVLMVRDPGHVQHAGMEKKPLDFGKFFASLSEIPGILLRSPALLFTMIGGCLLNFSVGTTYLDLLWIKAGGKIPPETAALWMGIVFLFGGTLGNVLGGFLGDWIQNHMGRHRLWAVMGSLLVCVPMMLLFRYSHPYSAGFWVGYFFVSFMVTMYYGPVFSTVQELSPAHQRSMIMAVFLIGMNLLGVSLGVTVAAALIPIFKGQGVQDFFTLALVVTGLAAVVSIPCFLYAIHLRKVQLAKQ